jgi:23S rRNA pseudouridine1911/1915/1917 synthase
MKREYVAFVEGRSASPKGTWRQWLELSENELHQQIVSDAQEKPKRPEAKEAITHFEVIAEYPLAGGKGWITKLRLRLETGCKHQIRIQAANAGLPLIGDRTYNPKYREHALLAPAIDFPRQALHAEVLTLEHPNQPGKQMSWRAELPKDLRQLEAALRSSRL